MSCRKREFRLVCKEHVPCLNYSVIFLVIKCIVCFFVLEFNTISTAKIISWLSHPSTDTTSLSKATNFVSHIHLEERG